MGFCPFFFRSIKMLNRGLDKLELLSIVDAVANEKSIDKELLLVQWKVRYKRQL